MTNFPFPFNFSAFDGRNILTPDEEEQLQLAKHKMLGNIKFIGKDLFHDLFLKRL